MNVKFQPVGQEQLTNLSSPFVFQQPADCKVLIERLKACSEDELLAELKKIETWTYGKCELYHWVDVLDLCDSILERACRKEHENSWVLACDLPQNKQVL